MPILCIYHGAVPHARTSGARSISSIMSANTKLIYFLMLPSGSAISINAPAAAIIIRAALHSLIISIIPSFLSYPGGAGPPGSYVTDGAKAITDAKNIMNIIVESSSSAPSIITAFPISLIQSDTLSFPIGSSAAAVSLNTSTMAQTRSRGPVSSSTSMITPAMPIPLRRLVMHVISISSESAVKPPTTGIKLSMEYLAVRISRLSADFVIIP